MCDLPLCVSVAEHVPLLIMLSLTYRPTILLRPLGMLTTSKVLGKTKCGLPGYNCNYKNNPDDDSKARAYDYGNFENGVYTGMKWQCVEFARRYWIYRRNVMIPNVQWAAHIIRFKEVARYKQGKYFNVPVTAYYNGGTEKPQEDDLLIYKSTPGQRVGHIAVVLGVTVSKEKNALFVGEQNQVCCMQVHACVWRCE